MRFRVREFPRRNRGEAAVADGRDGLLGALRTVARRARRIHDVVHGHSVRQSRQHAARRDSAVDPRVRSAGGEAPAEVIAARAGDARPFDIHAAVARAGGKNRGSGVERSLGVGAADGVETRQARAPVVHGGHAVVEGGAAARAGVGVARPGDGQFVHADAGAEVFNRAPEDAVARRTRDGVPGKGRGGAALREGGLPGARRRKGRGGERRLYLQAVDGAGRQVDDALARKSEGFLACRDAEGGVVVGVGAGPVTLPGIARELVERCVSHRVRRENERHERVAAAEIVAVVHAVEAARKKEDRERVAVAEGVAADEGIGDAVPCQRRAFLHV